MYFMAKMFSKVNRSFVMESLCYNYKAVKITT